MKLLDTGKVIEWIKLLIFGLYHKILGFCYTSGVLKMAQLILILLILTKPIIQKVHDMHFWVNITGSRLHVFQQDH